MKNIKSSLQTIFDMSPANIAILDDTGMVIGTNLAWKSFAKNNCLQKSIYLRNGWNYLDICESVSYGFVQESRMVAKAIRDIIKCQRNKFYWEYPCHSSQEERWFAMSVKRFIDDGAIRILVEHTNVTLDRQAKELLKFQSCIKQAADIVVITDKNGVIEYVNPAFEEIVGYSKEEVIGKTPRLYKSNIHGSDFYARLWQTILLGNVFRAEIINQKKNGHLYWEEKIITPLKNQHGEITHFVSTGKDITEQKQAKKARKYLEDKLAHCEKMEALGLLIGGVAHDLNNILQGIMAYPELLLNFLTGHKEIEYVEEIQKSSEKAADIIKDLLTLARRGTIVANPLNINSVISEYLESSEYKRLQICHSKVLIEIDLEKDILAILGSDLHLSRCIMNLITNAVEAMPDGGTVFISTKNCYLDRPIKGYDHVKKGDYIVLSVVDTGVGLAKEEIKRIFEPFYTKKITGSGIGLGMAVVWGTVKDHKGYISVQSSPGEGTTFSLYFPAIT